MFVFALIILASRLREFLFQVKGKNRAASIPPNEQHRAPRIYRLLIVLARNHDAVRALRARWRGGTSQEAGVGTGQ
jgi:hypothetical protein